MKRRGRPGQPVHTPAAAVRWAERKSRRLERREPRDRMPAVKDQRLAPKMKRRGRPGQPGHRPAVKGRQPGQLLKRRGQPVRWPRSRAALGPFSRAGRRQNPLRRPRTRGSKVQRPNWPTQALAQYPRQKLGLAHCSRSLGSHSCGRGRSFGASSDSRRRNNETAGLIPGGFFLWEAV